MSPFVKFGKIVKPHGVKGEFVLRPDFASASDYLGNCYLLNDGAYSEFPLTLCGVKPNGDIIVSCDMVQKYENVLNYIGKCLYVLRELLPPVEGFYVCDVIGLDVCTEDGLQIGTVTDVVDFGSGPMIEVQSLQKKEKLEYYLYDKYTIISVDMEQKKIFTRLPDYV